MPQAKGMGEILPGSALRAARPLDTGPSGDLSAVTLAGMSRSVILGAVRTPFGRLGGGLKGHSATELGAIVVRAALERAGIEPAEVEYVIMGQVLQGGAGQAPARQAAVGAGIPVEVPADTNGEACRAACQRDSQCRAWTYMRPGYQGPAARCFLKDRVTTPRRRPCCISGVVR